MEQTIERLFEAADLARVGDVTPATVRLDIAAGRLKPCAITARGARLFNKDELERYRAERRAQRTAPRGCEAV